MRRALLAERDDALDGHGTRIAEHPAFHAGPAVDRDRVIALRLGNAARAAGGDQRLDPGNTGMMVSEVGLGAWQLAQPDWNLDDTERGAEDRPRLA